MTEKSKQRGPLASKRRWWLLAFAILVILLFTLTYLPLGSKGREKIRLVRQGDGSMAVVEGSKGSWFDLHAGMTWENSSQSSTSTLLGSSFTPLAARTIWVVCLEDHELIRNVGLLVTDRLSELPFVDELLFFPPNLLPDRVDRFPDLFVGLDLLEISNFHIPGMIKMEAQVGVSMGKVPWGADVGHYTGPKAPAKEVCLSKLVHYECSGIGFYTGAAKYQAASRSIAASIAVEEEILSWSEEGGILPALPACFYGEASGQADVPAAVQSMSYLFASGPGLLSHNEAICFLDPGEQAIRQVDELKEELVAGGWEMVCDQKGDHSIGCVQMARGLSELKITERGSFGRFLMAPAEMINTRSGSGAEPAAEEKSLGKVCIHYVDRFSPEESGAAVDALIESGTAVDVVARFTCLMNNEQKAALAGRVLTALSGNAAETICEPVALLAMAELFHTDRKDDETARQLVRCTAAALHAYWDNDGIKDRLSELAKEMGDESLAELPVDAGILEKVGFVNLTAAKGTLEREIRLGQPVSFLIEGRDGETKALCLTVVSTGPGEEGSRGYRLRCIWRSMESGGASMVAKNGVTQGSPALWSCTGSHHVENSILEFDVVQKAGLPVRFDIEVKLRTS